VNHAMSNGASSRPGGLAAKRALDIVVALGGLVLAAPVLLLIALAVRVCLGAPVLFRQRRPGLGGQPFMLLKFRTMTDARAAAGELLPDDQRMTPLGRFLRRSSLDELPELINVLKGEMSLVGPRPLLMEYLPHYTPEQARRHEVRPGLTGWAAIHGRNATTWAERLQQDVWYVDHRSFALDCRILLSTVVKVLRQEGISPEGRVTMTRFDEEVGRKV
jgi:sugar transferase EpsL